MDRLRATSVAAVIVHYRLVNLSARPPWWCNMTRQTRHAVTPAPERTTKGVEALLEAVHFTTASFRRFARHRVPRIVIIVRFPPSYVPTSVRLHDDGPTA